MNEEQAGTRGRIAIAIGAAVLLGAIVVAVSVAGGGDDDEAVVTAPPQACLRQWNSDPAATSYGRHNFDCHDYEGALVTHLSERADEVGEDEGGLCAVIFPSKALDPEAFAAGRVFRRNFWIPISGLPGIELPRVGELQLEAAKRPNTLLDERGRLTAVQ